MPQGERGGGRACRLGDGRVLVMGGLGNQSRTIVGTVEAWAPLSSSSSCAGGAGGNDDGGLWTQMCSMRTARVNFGACTLPCGWRVIAVGGEVAPPPGMAGGAITQEAEVFEAQSNSWSALPPLSVERYGCGCAALADGAVLIAGGYGGQDRRPVAHGGAVLGGSQGIGAFALPGLSADGSGGQSGQETGGETCPAAVSVWRALPTRLRLAADRASASFCCLRVCVSRAAGVSAPQPKRLALGCACCAMFASQATAGAAGGRGRHLHSAELALDFGISTDADASAAAAASGVGVGSWTYLPAPALSTARKAFGE
eukprot:COSAG01_NODE_237_length_20722_cov_360.895747_11_plen_314_part_00